MYKIKQTKKYEDLVYDVGMHKGEDADFYLKKGFRVVGLEADPKLVAYCRNRFSCSIKKNKLTIVEGAIAEWDPDKIKNQTVTFYRSTNRVFGTICSDWAQRNELFGTSNEIIKVPVVDFSECLERNGIPHYLKIDIEGMDVVCLRTLLEFEQKPNYISLESEKVSFDKLVEEFDLILQLGYTRFKAIQQSTVSHQREPKYSKEQRFVGYQFQDGASGLFGADLPGEWKDYEQILNEYKRIFRRYRLYGDYGILTNNVVGRAIVKVLWTLLGRHIPGWYDTHAKHASVTP